ncbi:type VI secretion system tip protein TssI/VgrG [Yoonia sp.]|uniref:type VI secretion system Vgr family protein n=2 Tax=Yoonia sp. TaxID=2212373 RepID=UPI003297B141
MNAIFKQNDRMGSLSTILGQDVLNLLRFDGEEHLNGSFTYRVEALAKTDDLDFNALISTHATVSLKSYDLPETPFDGIIVEGEMLGQGENGWRYAFTLKPWLYLLSLRRKQQIYHNKTVVEILDELFSPYSGLGKPAVEKRLTGSYPTLEYTVQYRESDMDFATRLMERFGISYHFKHDTGSHTLVLTDTAISHDDLPGGAREFLMADNGKHSRDAEHFWDMRPSQRLTTGKIRLTDYNFKTPNAAMETDRDAAAPYVEGSIESYDYPGDYLAQSPGKDVARLRVEQERGQDPRHRALGDCASLRAGQKVKITGDKVPGVDKTLCLSASHKYASGGYGTTENGEPSFEGEYLFMPVGAPLAPERKTARPVVQGPQTAVVVGEGEIDCDEYGRILVHFHWDLDKRYSMRCRVSQNWAGKGWGGMVIPRIGMEVVVEFLEGDPDKPLVTGCVYNGKNDTPYPLPEHKTKSVFRSDTHKSSGFNELTFEDASEAEKIYMHGQKDQEIHIENDRTKRIDRNQFESVGRNKTLETGNNHHEVVGGNMTIMIGPNKLQQAVLGKFKALTSKLGDITSNLGLPDMFNMGEGNLMIGVAKNKAETIMLSATEVVGAGKATTVGGGFQTVVGGIMNTTVGIGSYEEVGQNKAVVVGKQYEIVVGDSRIVMDEDGTVSITGKKILMHGDDLVRITGKNVKIN